MTPLSCNCLSRPAPSLVILCSEPTRRSPGIVSCSGSHQLVETPRQHRPPLPANPPPTTSFPVVVCSWPAVLLTAATVLLPLADWGSFAPSVSSHRMHPVTPRLLLPPRQPRSLSACRTHTPPPQGGEGGAEQIWVEINLISALCHLILMHVFHKRNGPTTLVRHVVKQV